MASKRTTSFNPKTFLTQVGNGKTILRCRKNHILFSQGETAEAIFYIQAGRVKLTVVSKQGKEAVIEILESAAFFGEGHLMGQQVCMATAITLEASTIVRIDKQAMNDVLHNQPTFSALFLAHLLARNIRIQQDLVDHLFNSSEKRLAQVLLLMANFGKIGKPEPIVAKISQDALAEMIGTTRSRVSFFLSKFRKLGFIAYNGKMHSNGRLHVHSSLLNIILHD